MTTSRRGIVLCTSTVTLYHADGKHLLSQSNATVSLHTSLLLETASIAFVYFAGSLYHSSDSLRHQEDGQSWYMIISFKITFKFLCILAFYAPKICHFCAYILWFSVFNSVYCTWSIWVQCFFLN